MKHYEIIINCDDFNLLVDELERLGKGFEDFSLLDSSIIDGPDFLKNK